MTWHGSKQQSLTFSGKEGKEMKNKLKALASKRLHNRTKNSKAMPQEDSNENIDNESSTTNINEDDCSVQVSSALDMLVSKLDNFEQHFALNGKPLYTDNWVCVCQTSKNISLAKHFYITINHPAKYRFGYGPRLGCWKVKKQCIETLG